MRKATHLHRAVSNGPPAAKVERYVKYLSYAEPKDGWPAYSIHHPGPDIAKPETILNGKFFGGPGFAIWMERGHHGPVCQPISPPPLLISSLSVSSLITTFLSTIPTAKWFNALGTSHALTVWQLYFTIKVVKDAVWSDKSTLITGEPADVVDQQQVSVFKFNLDPTITFLLPSTQVWLDATNNDQDLVQIRRALQSGEHLTPALITEKCYFCLWQNNQLETEGGLLYYYERSKTARFRQLRLKIVPVALRATIIAACHSSPFGGHSGIKRTYYRVAARFYWPGMVHDITEDIRGCSHCQLANQASHEAQVELQTLAWYMLFDVVFLDIWSPGQITDKEHNFQVITMLDCMTGFARATFLRGPAIDSQDVAMASFAAFFIPFGIPCLIIVDVDGLFKGIFQATFQQLQMPILPVSPENHKACWNERCCSNWSRVSLPNCQQVLDHLDSVSLLLYKQRQLLDILNAERQQRHIELRNEGIKTTIFSPCTSKSRQILRQGSQPR